MRSTMSLSPYRVASPSAEIGQIVGPQTVECIDAATAQTCQKQKG
jgi:hypothetical protein